MNSEEILKNCSSKMKKAFEVFSTDLASLRTGRANASMLDIIKVEVYGQKMSVNQLATLSTPDARTLNVQVWDQNNVVLIDAAIKKSNLGVNPQIDGQLMRIPIPSLNQERRLELKKIMGGLAEKGKISIRNIRREANDSLKKNLKEKIIGEDECNKYEKKIQNLTDERISELEKKLDTKENKSRNYGHFKGIKSVETAIKTTIRNKIPYLTLYTFSTENWQRPQNEINFLFDLIRKSLKKNLKKIIKREIKINIIGVKKRLPKDISKIINYIEKKTQKNNKLTLNLALNYGSQEEIVSACRKITKNKIKEISIKNFEKHLYTHYMPNPDILIRTGGTKRLSNFLLWQLAYTEIFFIDKLWPDFNENDFNNIVRKFTNTKRNFGNI